MTPAPESPPDAHGPAASAVGAHLRRVAMRPSAPWLHTEIARRMVERLQWIKARPAVVIDWWGVNGGSRDLLQAHYPQARIDAVEPTAALVQRAQQAAMPAWWSPRRWGRAASQVWHEDESPRDTPAQLVWANMMLHWSADPAATFSAWRAAVAIDGFVMFSCFGPDTARGLRLLYRQLGWPPAAHDFIDMHDLGDALMGAGFADPVMDMETITLHWADAASALEELRALGGNAAPRRYAGLRTPRWRARLLREVHAALAGPDGRVSLSFEVVYGHAFQAPPRLAMSRETRVSADQLQAMARKGRLRPADA